MIDVDKQLLSWKHTTAVWIGYARRTFDP